MRWVLQYVEPHLHAKSLRRSFFLHPSRQQRVGLGTSFLGLLSSSISLSKLNICGEFKARCEDQSTLMAFWTSNQFVPNWTDFFSNYLWSSPPRLLETLPIKRRVNIPEGCELRQAGKGDYKAIVEFWTRYFSNWASCRCVVPVEHLQKMDWEILLVIREGLILGTVVRRKIRNLHIRQAKWSEAAVIDYFCVHPAWRKKSIGRTLLNAIHNTGLVSDQALPPQLIFWEGLKWIPPLSVGILWSRRGILGPGIPYLDRQKAWNSVKGDIWTDEPGEEISVWSAPSGPVIVWNTFHRSLPDGGSIGLILAGNGDELARSSPWSVLLMPGTLSPGPEWKMDSPFQWIGYNLSIGFVSSFPLIGF